MRHRRAAAAAIVGPGLAVANACGAPPAAEVSTPPPGVVVPPPPSWSAPGAGPEPEPVTVEAGSGSTTTEARPAIAAPSTVVVATTSPTVAAEVEPFTAWPPEPAGPDPWGNDAYRARILACIRSHEQGADGYGTETGNGYSGAYQFDPPTWYGAVLGAVDAGMLDPEDAWYAAGAASEAPAHVQDAAAWWLYLQRGFGPWPTPQARCAP